MLLSVVGSEEACRVVVDLISTCQPSVTQVSEEKEGVEFSCTLSLGEGVRDEEIDVTTGVVQGAQCVVYAVQNEVEAGDIVNQQEALGGRQPPFATVVTHSCHEEEIEQAFEKNRFYLGQYLCTPEEAEGLLWAVYHAMFAPAHVLWDRPQNEVTAVGWRAIQRTFWWFDRDLDDAWNDRELEAFLQAMKGPDGVKVTAEEVAETKQFIKEQQAELAIDNFLNPQGHLTHYAVAALCEGWLGCSQSDEYWGALRGVWNVLSGTGVHRTGLPWSAEDLDAVKVNTKEDLLQLSYTGAEFLKDVYEGRCTTPKNLWRFTPQTQWSAAGEPPWADVHGLPGSRDDPAEYSLEAFIASWRFTAARKYQHLIVFARCWGFDPSENPGVLFVKKRKREFREAEVDLPNILQCLVLGSPRCGKTSLRRRLADPYHNAEEPHDPTEKHSLTLIPQKTGETERFDLVLHEIPDRDVPTLLKDRAFMSHIDAVLLCYDGDDAYSFSYIAEKCPLVAQHKIPMLLVMTKMDLVGEDLCNLQDQEYAVQPNEFAAKWGLCWPPALVSNQPPSASIKERNEVDELPLSVSMLCRHPECHMGTQRASACKIACRLCTLTATVSGLVGGCVWAVRRWRAGADS
eukprot:TRINITY_DN1810_c0_g3_i1.p1 TRINITY_DN1810_c0_g3~~TRINITY_DN1810_c0_g3_i1.p1  ORF type:complete len:628 (+),score=224.63 TRINITY_DN1810_c0_g3_i1:69-1952(+)